MDQFIRNFKVKQINTEILDNTTELNEILTKYTKNLRNWSAEQVTYDFEIIVLTETWKIENLDLFSLKGYNITYNEGNLNQNDGVVLLIKEGISYEYILENIFETKVIRAKVNIEDTMVDILCIYKSPTLNNKDFLEHLDYYLGNKHFRSNINIIVGDINIDLLANDNISNEYLNIMSEHNFLPTINRITRNESK
ncbi:hypothetical protein NQ317_019315 [Molorchus minor]|uniref:Uncharacterized protein n=1 Tax=Molorchus minor TaxID=1323400 RepID=A0ABQ9J5F1_9CUCU|nr:hypothetical protein NQ317_019315 [Molorchus minor]